RGVMPPKLTACAGWSTACEPTNDAASVAMTTAHCASNPALVIAGREAPFAGSRTISSRLTVPVVIECAHTDVRLVAHEDNQRVHLLGGGLRSGRGQEEEVPAADGDA